MKKIVLTMLILLVAFVLVACADTAQNKESDESRTVRENNMVTEETGTSASKEDASLEEDTQSEEEEFFDTSQSHVLVAYFSVTGNTKNVAQKLATVTGGDIYEIRPVIEYTDADINYGDSDSRTSKEQNDSSVRPEIQGETISLEQYDTIYIGYPIWWGEEPRIMDTFVEQHDFGNIIMIPFCTSGSSGVGNSGKNLAKNAGTGNWLDGKRFASGVSESEIEEWISGLENQLP